MKHLIKGLRLFILFMIGLVSSASLVSYYLFTLLHKISKKISFKAKLAMFIILISILSINYKMVTYEVKTIEQIKIKEVVKEIKVESECTWSSTECKIYNKAVEVGLSNDQAKIVVAISKWETGSFKSNLCVNSYNYGGLYYNGKFMSFSSEDEGIEAFVNNLKSGYFDKGLVTIEQIQKKYCPVGAKNDPTGLNENWLSGVTYFYNNL